jgi:predicted unusual protein kinase regulating ubiquinone biosynthesis (AarF/ABC1/UbiB family)
MYRTLPTSKLQRGKVVGKTLLKIGATKSKTMVKRTFSMKNRDTLQEEMHEDVAKSIFDALGELKGLSVKIAQQVALGMPFLPPTYLKQMQKSFHQIPPINRALVRKIVKTELGEYPEKCFDTFENEAFGSASLGQVHLATLGDEKLAIKIQYPGIKKSIDSDLSILNFGLKRVAKGRDVSHLIKEVSDRIHEEVDYEIEAKNNNFFLKNFNMKDVVIPRVYEGYSTKHLLTSSFIEGKTFDQLLKSKPSQEMLNHYAQLIFDSFYHSVYNLQTIHADPNPGNFIFMDNGKIGLIDFGCVKTIEEDFLKKYNRLHLSLLDGISDEEVLKQYIELEMIDGDSHEDMMTFYRETIKPFDTMYIDVIRDDFYDFEENSDFSKKGFELVLEVQKKQFEAIHKINQEFIFLDRTLLGYYGMFEQMGVKIDTRNAVKIMREYRSNHVD